MCSRIPVDQLQWREVQLVQPGTADASAMVPAPSIVWRIVLCRRWLPRFGARHSVGLAAALTLTGGLLTGSLTATVRT